MAKSLGESGPKNKKGIEIYAGGIRSRSMGCAQNGLRVGIERPQARGGASSVVAAV